MCARCKESCQKGRKESSLAENYFLEEMSDVLKGEELELALKKCPEWEVSEDGKEIFRTIEFEEFTEAIDCVNDVAEMAEEAQHHPDFDIRFAKVTLRLTTHDVGGATSADIEMAGRIDNLVD